jgi:hypothetical protein
MAEKKNNDELQREILEAQLEQSKITLEQTRETSAAYRQRKESTARANAQRQRQFTADRANLRAIQKRCQHMAGGDAGGDPLEGGGKFAFSTLCCTIMPDGVTRLLQDPRCRLMLYGRERTPQEETKMEALAAKAKPGSQEWLAWDDHLWWKDLLRLFRKEGLGKKAIMRGPTFSFRKEDGTNVIPDITGYASSGAGGR